MRLIVYLLPALLWLGPASAESGIVVRGTPTIIDGDSIELSGKRLQLYGIDSPENGVPCERVDGQSLDCGSIARSALLDLTAGVDVVCQMVESEPSGAMTATCDAAGYSLNRNMIYTGWAVVDRSVTENFIEVEAEAKRAQRGLWRFRLEAPPWPEVQN